MKKYFLEDSPNITQNQRQLWEAAKKFGNLKDCLQNLEIKKLIVKDHIGHPCLMKKESNAIRIQNKECWGTDKN